MTETWRPVPGFEQFYSVSDLGQVRRNVGSRGFGGTAAPGRLMRQKKCANGYRSVSLYPALGRQKQLHVHRLVLLAFLGPPPEQHVVNHRDGDKSNNRLSNLEYVTPSENIRHAYANGLAKGLKGESNSMAALNWDTARAIRLLSETHEWSISSLARAFRIDTTRVRRILRNEIWKTN